MLKEFGGGLELTENWARNVLKSMNWTKRKGTTGKVGSSKKFYEKEKFTFQRKISNVILDHGVPSALVLNLDQTPFLMSLWGSIHFHQRGKIMFPLKGLMTKCKLQRLL